MTLNETTTPATPPEPSGLERILGTADHKTIGRMWMVSGAAVLVVGAVLSLVAAVEQVSLGGFSIAADSDELVQIWSAGRTLTLVGGVVGLLVGLATYLVPLQVGSTAIAFGRGANAAFWVWAISLDLLIASYLLNGGPGGGRRDFVALWVLSLGGALIGIMWALLCIATTVLAARAPGMTLERSPISAWAFCVWALLGLLSLPILLGQLVLSFIDVRYEYLSDYVGLASAINSISLAPAIYWLAIPTMGIAAEVVGVHAGMPIRFHRSIMAGLAALSITAFGGDILGFAGIARTFSSEGELGFKAVPFDNALLVVTLFAAVLPLLAIMALISDSLRSGRASMNPPMLGALLGAVLVLLGAVVALLGTIEPIIGFVAELANRVPETPDLLVLNGTTFNAGVTALVVGGALLGAMGATHHWSHKIWGRHLTEGLGNAAITAVLFGTLGTAIGNIGAGARSQPALPATGALPQSGVEFFNGLTALGVALTVLGVALFGLNMVRTAVSKGVESPYWSGHTLEWSTVSPPPFSNFGEVPRVASAFPLLDEGPASGAAPELEEVDA